MNHGGKKDSYKEEEEKSICELVILLGQRRLVEGRFQSRSLIGGGIFKGREGNSAPQDLLKERRSEGKEKDCRSSP